MKNETIKLYNIKYFPKQKHPKKKQQYLTLNTHKIYIKLNVRR